MFDIPELSMPSFPDFHLGVSIAFPVLSIILGVFAFVYFIFTIVLMYHWTAYGMRSLSIIFAEILYVVVSLALFTVAVLSLHYF